jgi:hypothetical protein
MIPDGSIKKSAAGGLPGVLFPLVVLFSVAGIAISAAQDAPAAGGEPAYDEAAVERGLLVFKEGGCRACHGWAANGVREGENIQGPSIRATLLPPDALRLTIQCGRPNALMPYFDHQAYHLDDRCYGITRFNVGDIRLPPRGRASFSEDELDDLVVYLMARIVGLPNEPTYEECQLFFGPDDNACDAIFRAGP